MFLMANRPHFFGITVGRRAILHDCMILFSIFYRYILEIRLIWGSWRQIARDVFNAFDKACELVERIVISLQRLEQYLDLFATSEHLQDILGKVYTEVLNFVLQALKLYDRSRIGTYIPL
jgi:hypothetical protein